MTSQIRLSDIAPASPVDSGFGTRQPMEQVVLAGKRARADMPSGMTVKIFDAVTVSDFETTVTRPANVILHYVLEGRIDAELDGMPLQLSRAPDAPVRLALTALRRPARFCRRGTAGERLRNIAVVLSWDFLEARGVTRDSLMGKRDVLLREWSALPPDEAAAEALMALQPGPGRLTPSQIMALESFGMSQAHGVLQRLLEEDEALSPREQTSLARMEAHALRPGPMASITDIAGAGAMSVSSARRLFRRAHGLPVMVYLRQLRLARADAALRAGANVSEATRLAGYETAEAFATAYRNWSGHSPSQTRRGAPRT